jgi:signal transduction histidine kinase
VTDTGVGIAPQFHSSLFEDFSQVSSPMQRKLTGTGLGLAVSRQMARLLGGTVGMESEVGKGSTFWVTIPVQLLQAPP